MLARRQYQCHGHVAADFEAVHQVFADNFAQRRELGAACCFMKPGAAWPFGSPAAFGAPGALGCAVSFRARRRLGRFETG